MDKNYFDIQIGFRNPEDVTEDMTQLLLAKGYETWGMSGHLINPDGDQPGGVCYMRKDKKNTSWMDRHQSFNKDRGVVHKVELPNDTEDFINFLIELP
jgi:hypothetical protein